VLLGSYRHSNHDSIGRPAHWHMKRLSGEAESDAQVRCGTRDLRICALAYVAEQVTPADQYYRLVLRPTTGSA
jgi:hypothetical protein